MSYCSFESLEKIPKEKILGLGLKLDLQGWGGDHKIFEDLISKIKPNVIIEVGIWKGQSTINMANILKKYNIDGKIYCVDTFLGSADMWDQVLMLNEFQYPQIYYQFLSNVFITENERYIIPCLNTSNACYEKFKYKDIKADLIYLDASHLADDVYNDIKKYFQLLNPGGIIFGDDYSIWPGVEIGLRKFCEENNKSYEVIDNRYWIISQHKFFLVKRRSRAGKKTPN